MAWKPRFLIKTALKWQKPPFSLSVTATMNKRTQTNEK
jgi:hypothetical protein